MLPNKARFFYTLSPKLRRPPRPLNDSLVQLGSQKADQTLKVNCSLNLHKRQKLSLEKQEKADKIQILRLKAELSAAKQEINSLKKAQSITSYQSSYQKKCMEEEIYILLQKHKNSQAQIMKLKEIIKQYRIQSLSKQSKSLLSFHKLNRQHFPNNKQNGSFMRNSTQDNSHQYTKPQNESSQIKLVRAIGQMFHKITGENYKSLGELWRWMKNQVYRLQRLRKWRKLVREALKVDQEVSTVQLVTLLKDAVIFIN